MLNQTETNPSALDDFLFDLNGFVVVSGAISPDLLGQLNAEFDALPRELPMGGWYRGSQRRDYNPHTGMELHNCVEIGDPFEELIDHPSWLGHMNRYIGVGIGFMQILAIDECIASIRTSGGHHPVHSGGYRGGLKGKYIFKDGAFQCGQVNVILALTDIGEGDGPTMVVPGSHKSNLPHPELAEYGGKVMDTISGAVPVYMKAGDALVFVDGLYHGGSERTNQGERRIIIYRYGPPWMRRFGYTFSDELLERLSPQRRKILQPVRPIYNGEARLPADY